MWCSPGAYEGYQKKRPHSTSSDNDMNHQGKSKKLESTSDVKITNMTLSKRSQKQQKYEH